MKPFEDINGRIVYTKTKSKTEALGMKDKANEAVQQGRSVAIIFNERYHLYLAPGQDPYQVRKDIDNFLNPPKDVPKVSPEAKLEAADKPKNAPIRDANGKFVSKKRSVLEPDPPTKEPPKKKSIWDALK